ncbi:E3 ubiquitin-protein ligase TRIM21-like [Epinephelus moara]|uniref:E3 ubiquitin-protein ligase TRIM21-like n=1 Tax=Epinephelus moara TaxID=300413 RepID=UPI00214E87F2|nr:E3 ubiquitin-protein ligase TRIM21-like [Epinephelus moara]
MAAASCLLTEDQFLCSICLDVFTDPVTIPCGHNFCKTCITEHWDIKVPSQCPNCNKAFNTRPELHVNTLFSEMAARYRQSAQQKPKEVPREVYSGTKLKALVFFLVCLMFVLVLWMVLDHKKYVVVLLKEEYEGKKAELEKTKAKTQQMIQTRQLKIEEIKRSVELSKEGADREIADGVQVFTALKESVERSLNKLINTIKEKQRKTEEQAEGFIKELEQEISELKKRSTELEQLSRSEDHLHLLQSSLPLNITPPTTDWTEVSDHPPSFEGTVRRAVNQLGEILNEEMTNLLFAELKRVQQYAVDVTLDPDTAQSWLIVSVDGKQVHDDDEWTNVPNNSERFDNCFCVLAEQSFSSGRFYFEVQVEGKTDWDLGVAKESVNRKGKIIQIPQKGYWTISLRNENEYKARAGPDVSLSLKSRPEKVGVFVDYEEGVVSFYDVDATALIYSFTGCCFTEKLYPFFSPGASNDGKNSAPVIISPVNDTE